MNDLHFLAALAGIMVLSNVLMIIRKPYVAVGLVCAMFGGLAYHFHYWQFLMFIPALICMMVGLKILYNKNDDGPKPIRKRYISPNTPMDREDPWEKMHLR